MAKGDWQALIPGWNIFYMIKVRRRDLQVEAERVARAAELQAQTHRVEARVKELLGLRDQAVASGSMLQAKVYEDEISRLVKGHINQLLHEGGVRT